MCATLAAHNVKLAQHEFKDPHLLTDDQILDIYKQIPMLVDWANAVGEHMTETAKNGKTWQGYKLVEKKKTQRRWSDEQAAINILSERSRIMVIGFDCAKTAVLKIKHRKNIAILVLCSFILSPCETVWSDPTVC